MRPEDFGKETNLRSGCIYLQEEHEQKNPLSSSYAPICSPQSRKLPEATITRAEQTPKVQSHHCTTTHSLTHSSSFFPSSWLPTPTQNKPSSSSIKSCAKTIPRANYNLVVPEASRGTNDQHFLFSFFFFFFFFSPPAAGAFCSRRCLATPLCQMGSITGYRGRRRWKNATDVGLRIRHGGALSIYPPYLSIHPSQTRPSTSASAQLLLLLKGKHGGAFLACFGGGGGDGMLSRGSVGLTGCFSSLVGGWVGGMFVEEDLRCVSLWF